MALISTTAIIIAGLVLSGFSLVDKLAGDIFKSANGKKLKARAEKLANDITKNQELTSKLMDAYNRKDAALAQSILMSSPFGGSVRVLRDSARKLEQDYKEKKNILDEEQKRLNHEQETINQAQDNIGGGIIGGIYGTVEANSPETKPSQDYNALVNGGINEFEKNEFTSDLIGPQKLNQDKRSTN